MRTAEKEQQRESSYYYNCFSQREMSREECVMLDQLEILFDATSSRVEVQDHGSHKLLRKKLETLERADRMLCEIRDNLADEIRSIPPANPARAAKGQEAADACKLGIAIQCRIFEVFAELDNHYYCNNNKKL